MASCSFLVVAGGARGVGGAPVLIVLGENIGISVRQGAAGYWNCVGLLDRCGRCSFGYLAGSLRTACSQFAIVSMLPQRGIET